MTNSLTFQSTGLSSWDTFLTAERKSQHSFILNIAWKNFGYNSVLWFIGGATCCNTSQGNYTYLSNLHKYELQYRSLKYNLSFPSVKWEKIEIDPKMYTHDQYYDWYITIILLCCTVISILVFMSVCLCAFCVLRMQVKNTRHVLTR
jgi:hypothetical protein